MEEILSAESFGVAATVLLKLGIAVFLGAVIGFEREKHGRPAGLRTHMLVALGVTLFCLVSSSYKGADPTRISAQVVTGIGFLGAGTILRLGAEVRGLTSAASIWATSAIAMAVARGGPFLVVAAVATGLALVTLAYIERIEIHYRPKSMPTELTVTLQARGDLHSLVEKLTYDGFQITSVRTIQTEPEVQVALIIPGPGAAILNSTCSLAGG